MFDLSNIATSVANSGQLLWKTIKKNDRLVMTVGAGAGVVVTAVLAAKGAVEAQNRISDVEASRFNERINAGMTPTEAFKDLVTPMDKIKISAPCYAPAIVSGAITEVLIAKHYTTSEAVIANLAGVVKLCSDELRVRKEKEEEIAGPKKAALIDGAVAKEEVLADPPVVGKNVCGAPGSGKTLIKDHYTGQYVWSSRDRMERLCVRLNNILSHGVEDSIPYNELLIPAGFDRAGLGEEFGFNEDHQLYPEFTAISLDDDERDRFNCDTMLLMTFGCGEFNRDGGPCWNFNADWPVEIN